MMLKCPGCGAVKKYEKMFEHIQECDKLTDDHRTNRMEILQSAVNAV